MRLRTFPSAALTTRSLDVTFTEPCLIDKARQMRALLPVLKGFALAGCQVGIMSRFFVIGEHQHMQGMPWFIANPLVVEQDGGHSYQESCLSMPGLRFNLMRANRVKLQYHDEEGRMATIEETGLRARVLLHEIDHLDGVLFHTRLNIVDRDKAVRQLNRTRERL